jgi:hypothetical protein
MGYTVRTPHWDVKRIHQHTYVPDEVNTAVVEEWHGRCYLGFSETS